MQSLKPATKGEISEAKRNAARLARQERNRLAAIKRAEIIEELLPLLEEGRTLKLAARWCNVSESAVLKWRHRDAEIDEVIRAAWQRGQDKKMQELLDSEHQN